MSYTNVLKRGRSRFRLTPSCNLKNPRRALHYDGRNRLTNLWNPTQRQEGTAHGPDHGHDLLVRAGFLRQAHSGIFHFLPFGLRVQNKLERLIDKHMQSIAASKVSLSSISSEELWQRSGRLDKSRSSELLRLQDRKGAKYLLSPTHEEEITTLVANALPSYRDLPLRLYQVSRKYRDEPRPRQGLLRGREFLMKDLYTFDVDHAAAIETYEEVRRAYVNFLEDLGLPYLVARADSGNMGGTLSHEYHFASSQGEDTVLTCDSCDLSMNEELYIGRHDSQDTATASNRLQAEGVESEQYISKDRQKVCFIYFMKDHGTPNMNAVKAVFPEVDTSTQAEQVRKELKDLDPSPTQTYRFRDPRAPIKALPKDPEDHSTVIASSYPVAEVDGRQILLTKIRENDACPSCKHGKVKLHQAVEIGHTFHLGQHYSVPFNASYRDAEGRLAHVEMGCHGIGVSRLLGAVATLTADEKGLNWPLALAPFEAVIVPGAHVSNTEVDDLYDSLEKANRAFLTKHDADILIDDRNRPLGWKLNDADLIGYPFIIVMGKSWREKRHVELQCRRRGLKEDVPVDHLASRIRQIAEGL